MNYGLVIFVVLAFATAAGPPASAPADVAPPVAAIAEKATNEDYVRGRMLSPHLPMPDFALSRRDLEDLLAYFASVRGK